MDKATEFSLAFLQSQPSGAARVLDTVASDDAAALLADASPPSAAGALAHMQATRAAAILRILPPKRTAELLLQMPANARSVILRALPEETTNTVLETVSSRQRAAIRRYLAYAPGTVGVWMDAPHAAFVPETTVADCLRQVRALGQRAGFLVCVIDTERRLRGCVAIDRLLGASDAATLDDIMQRDVVRLSPQAPLTTVVSLAAWDVTLSMPVVDRGRRLVGVLNFDSVREGLVTDRAAASGLPVNRLVVQIAEAYLVCLSGMLHVTTAPSDPTRLADWQET